MRLSPLNTMNFKGEIVIHNPYPDADVNFNTKIKASPALQEVAANIKEDIHVHIKRRLASDHEIYNERRDSELYKVILKLKKPVRTLFDKIANFFSAGIPLTSQYHSEHTTLKLLHSKKYIAKLFYGLI